LITVKGYYYEYQAGFDDLLAVQIACGPAQVFRLAFISQVPNIQEYFPPKTFSPSSQKCTKPWVIDKFAFSVWLHHVFLCLFLSAEMFIACDAIDFYV
jgi:hypothetical protein